MTVSVQYLRLLRSPTTEAAAKIYGRIGPHQIAVVPSAGGAPSYVNIEEDHDYDS